MIISLSIEVPDGLPAAAVAAYFAEQADNFVGQLQTGIIDTPAIDESIYIDTGRLEGFEAIAFRSE